MPSLYRAFFSTGAFVCASIGVTVTASSPAFAADKIELTNVVAVAKKGAKGTVVQINGQAVGAPDGTTVNAVIALKGTSGMRAYTQVAEGHFSFQVAGKKVLPGTYEVKVSIDPRVQRTEVTKLMGGSKSPVQTTIEFVHGSPNEAELEREKLLKKYTFYMDTLRGLYGGLGMWGGSITSLSGIEKIRARGRVPRDVQEYVIRQWENYSSGFEETLPTIRFDLQQFTDYVLVSYWPDADVTIGEIITSLERWHASFTVAIHKNLGVPVPKEAAEKGKWRAGDLRKKFPTLSERTYKVLGLDEDPWYLIDEASPEKASDAKGDIFKSSVAKFLIKKPSKHWFFDTGANDPSMRLRIRLKDPKVVAQAVSGVELRDYPTAQDYGDLARLDQWQTRHRWPGFELIKTKRVEAPDPTMPKGIRPGQEMRFWIQVGEDRYYILQYALFCRWKKRTYNVMGFAHEKAYKTWVPVLEGINETFMILDDPDKDALKKAVDERMKILLSDPGGQGQNSKEGAR
jgi:hypothetical protein